MGFGLLALGSFEDRSRERRAQSRRKPNMEREGISSQYEGFLRRVEDRIGSIPSGGEAQRSTRAILRMLGEHLSNGEKAAT